MGGRVTGNVDRAMDTLKRKAVAINRLLKFDFAGLISPYART
jgi:hypothetical protein